MLRTKLLRDPVLRTGLLVLSLLSGASHTWGAGGGWDLNFTVLNRSGFSTSQIAILDEALIEAEQLWERQVLGTHNDAVTTFNVTVSGTTFTNILANANSSGEVDSGEFKISSGGSMRISYSALDNFSDFQGVNVISELIAHEVGHAMGIGTKWFANGVYVNGTGRYTGQHGLRAYREDFDPTAEFIPVELNGGSGTRDAHWDQLMRSAGEAGTFDPNDIFALDPRIGIVDKQGRDLSLELMTGAIDPDYGEPFLARFTVQSLRDIGFVVVPEPSAGALIGLCSLIAAFPRRRY